MKRIILLLTLLLYFVNISAQTTVTATPGNFTDDGGDGVFGHANLSTSNNVYECVNLDKNDNVNGKFDQFGFTIPAGALITSITVTLEGAWNTATAPKNHKVSLWNSTDKSDKFINAQFALTHVESTITNTDGGADIWGFDPTTELTPAMVNDPTFGINIEQITSSENGGQLCLDFAEISITYTGGLPVELVEFNTYLEDNNVKLEWTTAAEINNDRFEVYRSSDGTTWELLTTILGAGNSNNILKYSIYDMSPLLGVSYYRLKQIDIDGRFDFSKTVTISNYQYVNASIYPNPTNGNFLLKIQEELVEDFLVVLKDQTGRDVYSKVIVKNYTSQIVVFDIRNKISSGIYYVTGTNNKQLFNKKILVI